MLTFGTRGRLPVMTLPRVQAILDEQAQHRARLEGFCRSLTEQELAEQVPGTPWKVHGYVAHLATIDSLISPFLAPLVGMTDVPRPELPPPTPFDIDEWNADLDGVAHSRPIGIAQELVAHVPIHFQGGNFQTRTFNSIQCLIETKQCLQFRPTGFDHFRLEQFR